MGMIFYDQTTFSDTEKGTHGDCCRACVSTILRVEPETLPHPIASCGGWNTKFHKALRNLGFAIRTMDYDQELVMRHDLQDASWGYITIPRIVMAAGPSPRGPWLHAVVYDRHIGEIVHDPHPSRDGLREITAIDYLAPYPRPDDPT